MIATAEVIRHLDSVPMLLLGLAVLRWARPVARFFASAHRWLYHSSRFGGWLYEEPVGPWFIRAFAVIWVAVSAWWIVVGTG